MNKVILVGNPNVGKTTLFNTLTNSHEKASNWHGVTVAEKSKTFKIENKEYECVDLPGMYSIFGYSNEEKIANRFLEKNREDLIINICDANNLARNLRLTKELLGKGYNIILAINMSNEVKSDSVKLAKILGITVVPIDARKTKSVNLLKKEIHKYFTARANSKICLSPRIISDSELNIFLSEVQKVSPYKVSDKIDKVVLNKFAFPLIFLSSIFLVFFLTFGPVGDFVSLIFNFVLDKFFNIFRKIILGSNMSFVLKNFFVEGILNSASSICSFLPQILMLMILINFLEDIGFMSRVAFMFDGVLKKFGLTGKSIFSLMMGYGCTTSAIMTTRNLENKNLRKRTALLLPFSTCSAKLPVFLVISSLFFDKYKYFFVFGLYIFAFFVSLVCAIIFKKIYPDKGDVFILEMPKYRLPNIKKVLSDSVRVLVEFLIKVGTLILFFSSILWVLQNFSPSFDYLQGVDFDKSILYFLSSKLAVLFKPIGLGSAGIVASLLLGLVAKELVVVGLAMINGVSGVALVTSLTSANSICSFTWISSIVFLVFILLYSPCISALGAVKGEFGKKTALFVFLFQFCLSYAISFVVYQSLNNPIIICIILGIIALDIFGILMLKLFHKKFGCRGNCNACRKI